MIKYVLSILAVGFALTGCHTFEGVGKDVQSGGKAIERTSEKVQQPN